MTDITTGTVASSGTKLYIVGTASEMDTSALIEAAYEQKTTEADSIDIRIEENQTEISAYTTLQELGETMVDALELLKATYGYSTSSDSVYDNMTSYLSASDSSDVNSIIDVNVEDTAVQGSYTLEVSQLATKMKMNSASVSSKEDTLGLEGDFTLTLESGTTVEIEITSAMSLDDISDAINEICDDTKISSSIVKTSDSSYNLIITGTETGEEITYASTSGTNIMQSLGVVDTGGNFANITQEAQGAIVYLDDLEITSSSNTIEDVLEGVSLTLYSAQEDTTISLEIDYDYTATKEAITAFIDAYNEFREFVLQNQTVDSSGNVDDDAVLFSDSLLDNLNSQVSTILTSVFGGDSVTNLGDLGVTFDDSNYLEIIDEDTLNSALLNNYDDLQAMFQTSVETDSDQIALITNNSTATSTDISLDIGVDTDGNITTVTANGQSDMFEINGTRLIGAENTIYEGMTFAYVDDVSATVNISITQGMADLLYNAIDAYTNSSDGVIQNTILEIQSVNSQLDTEADRIRELADEFYEDEVLRYAQMEVEIQAAETLLSIVQALIGTSDDS